tara:strand:- start:1213 stop:2334 length:1122 start_codon:yes stop_codon:yes gene_type:complete
MPQTNQVNDSAQIATSANFDHSFQGYQLSDYTTKIESSNDILYLDGKTIISDGNLAIGTQNTNDSLFFGTVNTAHVELDHNGVLNLLTAKMSLGSGKSTGSSGQVLSTDGNGNLYWQTVDYTQFAVGSFAVSGQNTVSATSTSQQVTFAEGSGIQITTDSSSKTITIANTGAAANAFKNFAVTASGGSASGAQVVADTDGDTLTFVAGSGVTLATSPTNDQITISSSTAGEANQNAVTNITAPNQTAVTATSATDTITLDGGSGRNRITVTTDPSNKTVDLQANISENLSHSGKVPVTDENGVSTGARLYNHFINTTIGGETFGASTRVVRVQDESGTTQNLTMQAKSDGTCLLLPVTDENGTVSNIEIDMTE